jgi:hypothetical protein
MLTAEITIRERKILGSISSIGHSMTRYNRQCQTNSTTIFRNDSDIRKNWSILKQRRRR